MTQYEIQVFKETAIKGYPAALPLPTLENVKEVSEKKSQHFFSLAKSGKFPALMAESTDKIGYALSEAKGDVLEYFAGANTTTNDPEAQERIIPSGEYIVLKEKVVLVGNYSINLSVSFLEKSYQNILNCTKAILLWLKHY